MLDRVDNSLKAAAKALREVVAPAVDPTVPQANEQIRFAIDILEIVRWQLAHESERDAAELRIYSQMAEQVLPLADGLDVSALQTAIARAAEIHEAGQSWRDAVHDSVDGLRTAISLVVTDAQSSPKETRDAIERAVLRSSQQAVANDRAWYLPFGMDPAPDDVEPYDQES